MTSETQIAEHHYISTACMHGLCDERCRSSCKYCGAMCQHDCHPQDGTQTLPPPWVDQARDLASALLAAVGGPSGLAELSPALYRRYRTDPHLFWLRGEVQPPGEWTPADIEH
jgi:hypothetical protein